MIRVWMQRVRATLCRTRARLHATEWIRAGLWPTGGRPGCQTGRCDFLAILFLVFVILFLVFVELLNCFERLTLPG
jgi:hypothetical protein